MENRGYEYSCMVRFMVDMENAMRAYDAKEYEKALHLALNGIDDALSTYLAIVNDYPYNRRQWDFAREVRGMVDREQLKIEEEFENKMTQISPRND